MYPAYNLYTRSDDSESFETNTVVVQLETRIPMDALRDMPNLNAAIRGIEEKFQGAIGGTA